MVTPSYLFVLPWSLQYPGGVNEVVTRLYDGLDQDGTFRPIVLSTEWDATRPRQTIENGRTTIYFRLRSPISKGKSIMNFLGFILKLPWSLRRLKDLITQHDVKVINIHYLNGASIIFVILRKLGLFNGKLIVSLHGTDLRSASDDLTFRYWVLNRVLTHCDQIVCCSEGLRSELSRFYPNLPQPGTVIYNGTDIESVSSTAGQGAQWAKYTKAPYVLTIGTFTKEKGLDLLIESFGLAAKHLPPDLRLVIVGRIEDYFSSLVTLTEKIGIADRVEFHKNLGHEKCMALLNSAEFFVLPSRKESFSIALLEAASLKKAVISTDVCGVRELISRENLGIVIPVDDQDALAEAISRLATRREYRDILAHNLHLHVAKNFSWSTAVDSYCNLAK